MSVAVELAGDDVRVAADDGVEVGAPHPHAVHVAGWDVAQDVHLPEDCCNSKNCCPLSAHLFPLQLCQLKFKYKPEQFISGVFGVEEQPEVLVHAVVHVQADYSKARKGGDTVIGTMPGLLP